MADLSILAGATSQSINVDLYIQATGAPQTALVYNSTGLTAYYSFTGANATSTAITLATLATATTAYSSGGFIKLDDTNMPGLYRLDLPNAAIAASKGREVIVTINGFAGMAVRHIKIELTGWDNQNANNGGLAVLPATAVPGAANGIFIAGTNAAVTVTGATVLTGNVSMAAGLTVTQSSSNAAGVSIIGNGSGAGILSTGGATGHGISATSGATSGNGINTTGNTLGHGISSTGGGTSKHGLLLTAGGTTANGLAIIGGSTSGAGVQITTTSGDGISSTPTAGHGITLTGQGTAKHGINAAGGATTSHGASFTGGGVGHGILATSGGGSTGDGIQAISAATNGNGFNTLGKGTGAGHLTTGGLTGNGMSAVGGGTSGDAILTSATSGHGITAAGTGTTKHGINATGGATTSHGISATGGGAGHGIKAISGSGATGDGINATSQATAGNGITATHNGSAVFDLNATTTPLTLAKTTNITGFNDIAATAIVSSGAITTSGGKVSEVALVDTLTTYTGNTPQTGDAYAIVNNGTYGNSALHTEIGSPMQAYTQPTGFLAATFPSGTIANTTNITAGTMTTTTNLTNAATAGDLTATMKTSVTTAANAATTVGISSNRKKGSTATFEFLMTLASNGAPATGLTVASTISKDGGADASTANAVTEIALGQYQIVLTNTEMTANNIFLQFTAATAVTYNLGIQTQP